MAELKGNPYRMQGWLGTALGAAQIASSLLMSGKDRPTYVTPEGITENQRIAKNLYGASTFYGVPGQRAINNQNQSALASALRAYQNSQQTPATMLAGVTATTANQQRTNADLGIKAAQARQANINAAAARLMSANQTVAQYKDKEFEYNLAKPFSEYQNTKAQLIGGGIQNTSGGLGTLGGAKYRKQLDEAYLDYLSGKTKV
jgi:hypothetical protein